MITSFNQEPAKPRRLEGERILLPNPVYDSSTSIEDALHKRRSVRVYQPGVLTLAEVGQLLWAAQGITGPREKRTAPSAGHLYPLEIYLVCQDVEEISQGIYHYLPGEHVILRIADGDFRERFYEAARKQDMLLQAAAIIIVTAVYERTSWKYGDRTERYVHMEVGCVAQNVALQVESLGLGTVFIGAFQDEDVKKILSLPEDEHPLCLLPVGRK